MDAFKSAFGGGEHRDEQKQNENNQEQSQGDQGSGGFLGSLGDKLNAAAGGGKESEKNEDMLDKGKPYA